MKLIKYELTINSSIYTEVEKYITEEVERTVILGIDSMLGIHIMDNVFDNVIYSIIKELKRLETSVIFIEG